MSCDEWVKTIAVFRNPRFGFMGGEHGEPEDFVLAFTADMEHGSAGLLLWGEDALKVVQAYGGFVDHLVGRTVWVEVEPTGGCPTVRYLEPCLIR